MDFLVFCITLLICGLSVVYCVKPATKIEGLDDPITIIQDYPDNQDYPNNFCSVHVITNKGEIFYVRGGDDRVFKESDVPLPITAMHTFTKDYFVRKVGDIFFGTTDGVYLRKAGDSVTTKMNGTSGLITIIQEYPDSVLSVHVVNSNGKLYKITGADNSVTKETDVPFPVRTMHTFTTNGGNHETGDIVFGTSFGVYLRKSDESTASRNSEIKEPVDLIQEYPDSVHSVHVITDKGQIYNIRGGYESEHKQTDVPFPVLKMYTFTKKGGKRNIGDIYFGTTSGIYLRKTGEQISKKIGAIHEPVKIIQEYPDKLGSVHIITDRGDIYFIRGEDENVFKQDDVPFPVTMMFTFTRDGGNRRTGDIYFGTTNGIYLRKVGL